MANKSVSTRITRNMAKSSGEYISATSTANLEKFKSKPKKKLAAITENSSPAPIAADPKTKVAVPQKKAPSSKRAHTAVESSQNKTESNAKTSKAMPANWEIMLNNVREMRKNSDAPVDTMGCHKCSDETESPPVSQFKFLGVAL